MMETMTVAEIFPDLETFLKKIPYLKNLEASDQALIFETFIGKYWLSHVRYTSHDAFILEFTNVLRDRASIFVAQIKINADLLKLTTEDYRRDSSSVSRMSANGERELDDSDEVLEYTDHKAVSINRLSEYQALLVKYDAIKHNVVRDFLEGFRFLFSQFIPDRVIVYD